MDTKCQLHGAFSWCELLTTDVEDAKHFYSKLFNWTLEPAPIPGVEYTLVKYGGEKMGGIMAIPPAVEGEPPCWGVYVTVDDVETTAKLAVEMGGKILMPPHDIPEVGRFCVLQDPQGAMISAITYLPKTICDTTKNTEVLAGLSCENRDGTDEMVRKAIATGGTTYNEPQDHEFIYEHGYQDLD